MRTSVINATLFPVALFKKIGFDENLVYGSDESDITNRAVALGDKIVLIKSAVNQHFHSPLHRDDYSAFREGSRLYSTFKLYYFVQGRRLKGLLYVPCAVAHLTMHGLRRRGVRGLVEAFTAIKIGSQISSALSLPENGYGASDCDREIVTENKRNAREIVVSH